MALILCPECKKEISEHAYSCLFCGYPFGRPLPTIPRKDTIEFDNLIISYERELIIEALKKAQGNQAKAAEILGISKRIIQYKVLKYGINYRKFRGMNTIQDE